MSAATRQGVPGTVTKAVLPVAGLGTRFLPATKATPKEMLPVVDKPAIQYVVEEAVAAGLHDVLLVTGRNKNSLENHFDRNWELEAALEAKGDRRQLARLREATVPADIHYVRQGDPRGLGHAVSRAAAHVGREPFAVLLGDDLIADDFDGDPPLLSQMLEVRDRFGGSVLALIEVPPEQISLYGAAAVEPTDTPGLVRVVDLVEKPEPGQAPSSLALIGRYVLDPAIFDVLERTPPGRGGEIQLTDALRTLAHQGAPVHGVVYRGRRYDTGDRLAYLEAVVQIACAREDLGPPFREWLRAFVAGTLVDGPDCLAASPAQPAGSGSGPALVGPGAEVRDA
jgi:UTP--glucose-1-phosphate uridylyltransferase